MKKSIMHVTSLAAVLISILAAGQAHAEGIFPDKNLEAVVRKYVFEKRSNNAPIAEDDVVNISAIVGKGRGIKDLTGLEKCRSLAKLDLEDNLIEDISAIKELKNVQQLILAKNKIKDAGPVAGLTKLQYLDLSSNQISDLAPLGKLENMRSLYLSHNQIKAMQPIAELTKVWSLYVDGNQIADISPLAKLKNLDTLDLRGNNVVDLSPLKGLAQWKYLFLDNNKVTDLGVLIAMGRTDKESSQQFALFWNIYLSGNPLSDNAKKVQLDELKKVAKTVQFAEE